MLTGKVALITGAGSGIGKETAKILAENHAKVVINYRKSEDGAKKLKTDLLKNGLEAEIVQGDILIPQDCRRIVDFTVKTYGKIDILINNSGDGLARDSILDITQEEFDNVIDTNIKGTYHCTIQAIKHMKKQGSGGSIVSISTSAVKQPRGGTGPYVMTKAAIELFMLALAQEFGEFGIRCNTISPGPNKTPMLESFFTEERIKQVASGIPLRRVGQPTDIANGILYLVSDMSSYVTGQNIVIDGGRTIR